MGRNIGASKCLKISSLATILIAFVVSINILRAEPEVYIWKASVDANKLNDFIISKKANRGNNLDRSPKEIRDLTGITYVTSYIGGSVDSVELGGVEYVHQTESGGISSGPGTSLNLGNRGADIEATQPQHLVKCILKTVPGKGFILERSANGKNIEQDLPTTIKKHLENEISSLKRLREMSGGQLGKVPMQKLSDLEEELGNLDKKMSGLSRAYAARVFPSSHTIVLMTYQVKPNTSDKVLDKVVILKLRPQLYDALWKYINALT